MDVNYLFILTYTMITYQWNGFSALLLSKIKV